MTTNSERKLLPIPLLGAGTQDIESFSSYVHRMAYDHGVYVGELLRYVYSSSNAQVDSASDKLIKAPRYVNAADLIRPNALTQSLVLSFEKLSGQNLGGSIAWFLDHSIGTSQGEIVKGFRWCPECFAEMRRMDQECYFKLIWHMSSIRFCPIHKSKLLDQCEHCGCDQKTYKKQYPLGNCQNCGRCLSERKKPLGSEDVEASWECFGADIQELFRDIATIEKSDLPQDGVKKSIEHLFKHYWGAEREEEFYGLLPESSILAIVFEQRQISLTIARRIAYRLGLSLFTLLSGNAHMSSEVINSEWYCPLPPSHKIRKKDHAIDHKEVLEALYKAISTSEVPFSVKALAKRVNVSVGYLEYRHPLLVKQVATSHRQFVDKLRENNHNKARLAAFSYFVEKQYEKYPKSRKKAYEVLREETGLPKFILKHEINSVYKVVYGEA